MVNAMAMGVLTKEYYIIITLHSKHRQTSLACVHEAQQTAWRHPVTSGEQLWRQQPGARSSVAALGPVSV